MSVKRLSTYLLILLLLLPEEYLVAYSQGTIAEAVAVNSIDNLIVPAQLLQKKQIEASMIDSAISSTQNTQKST